MKPHPEKNFIMVCCSNELIAKSNKYAGGGDILLRWKCPSCGKSSSYKIESENDLLEFQNAMEKYKKNE